MAHAGPLYSGLFETWREFINPVKGRVCGQLGPGREVSGSPASVRSVSGGHTDFHFLRSFSGVGVLRNVTDGNTSWWESARRVRFSRMNVGQDERAFIPIFEGWSFRLSSPV